MAKKSPTAPKDLTESRERESSVQTITIPAPRLRTAQFTLTGLSPYVCNKFSERAKEDMIRAQEAGGQSKSRRKRDPKDFNRLYLEAIHYSDEGWAGIPAAAIRAAMIDSCRLVDFKMTIAKLSVFVIADGYDRDDRTALVRIYGEPKRVDTAVRNATGVADIRPRPMWDAGWTAHVRVQFDEDKFSGTDVANLLARAGQQNGIGAGRPNSKESYGQGWGLFTIETKD